MVDNVTISNTELLYDPLFDKKPDVEMKAAPYNETTAKAFIDEFTEKYGNEVTDDVEEYEQISNEAFYQTPLPCTA